MQAWPANAAFPGIHTILNGAHTTSKTHRNNHLADTGSRLGRMNPIGQMQTPFTCGAHRGYLAKKLGNQAQSGGHLYSTPLSGNRCPKQITSQW